MVGIAAIYLILTTGTHFNIWKQLKRRERFLNVDGALGVEKRIRPRTQGRTGR